ncbi:MAG: hypothetical protein PHU85_01035 [Phycisphaerae bacterium]|nr:hypothetical protein [Phycisphaerae bacterium]
MSEDVSSRRQFLSTCGRIAGLLAVGGVATRLVISRDSDKVWQLDPSVCDGCAALNKDFKGLSKCSTQCVLKLSAVKAVNDFTQCGYCRICPGYHDVNSPKDPNNTPKNIHNYDTPMGRVCPFDALIRRPVGYFDKSDPKNNFYEYVIDEAKCTGCGKCVVECGNPGQGNGSLRLEVRRNLCVNCNECGIARACPAPKARVAAAAAKVAAQKPAAREQVYQGAFYRDDVRKTWPSRTARPAEPDKKSASLPCGPNPFTPSSSEGRA